MTRFMKRGGGNKDLGDVLFGLFKRHTTSPLSNRMRQDWNNRHSFVDKLRGIEPPPAVPKAGKPIAAEPSTNLHYKMETDAFSGSIKGKPVYNVSRDKAHDMLRHFHGYSAEQAHHTLNHVQDKAEREHFTAVREHIAAHDDHADKLEHATSEKERLHHSEAINYHQTALNRLGVDIHSAQHHYQDHDFQHYKNLAHAYRRLKFPDKY